MNHETLNACPHCGAENEHSTRKYLFKGEPAFIYECGSLLATDGGTKTTLCAEREARQKAEAEVERLKEQLKRAIEIAELPYCRYLHDAATYHELTKLKATLNPTNK